MKLGIQILTLVIVAIGMTLLETHVSTLQFGLLVCGGLALLQLVDFALAVGEAAEPENAQPLSRRRGCYQHLAAHKVNGCNEALIIAAIDDPGIGGACHLYEIRGFDANSNPSLNVGDYYDEELTIVFQNGAIKEAGVNGVTHESLLTVLIHRLEGFQSGKFACDANAVALAHLREALESLKKRTIERAARGVEGTLQH